MCVLFAQFVNVFVSACVCVWSLHQVAPVVWLQSFMRTYVGHREKKKIQVNSASISSDTSASLLGLRYQLSAKLITVVEVRWPLISTKSSLEGAFWSPLQSRVLEWWESRWYLFNDIYWDNQFLTPWPFYISSGYFSVVRWLRQIYKQSFFNRFCKMWLFIWGSQ